MTTNNDDNSEDQKHPCRNYHCCGIVKEYEEGGVREMPDEAKEDYGKLRYKLHQLGKKMPYVSVEPVTWFECSLCHEYHSELF